MTFEEHCVSAIDAIIAQGRGSFTVTERGAGLGPATRCMYRGPDNLKCVVGQLIKDEYYHLNLEQCSSYDNVVKTAVATSIGIEELSEEQIKFLGELQSIHDEASDEYVDHPWKIALFSAADNRSTNSAKTLVKERLEKSA